MNTQQQATDRQEIYYEAQARVLQTLDAVRAQVEAHGAKAARGEYHWGYIGDLTHLQEELAQLLTTTQDAA